MYRAKVNGEWCGMGDENPRTIDSFYVVQTNKETSELEAYEMTDWCPKYGFSKKKLPDANIEIKEFNVSDVYTKKYKNNKEIVE